MDSKTSVGIALATAGVVWVTYDHFMPSVVDHRVGQAGDKDANAAERAATMTASAVVGALWLVTKDPLVMMLGAGTIVALAWTHRHANMVNPLTSRATVAESMGQTAATSDDATGAAYQDSVDSGAY